MEWFKQTADKVFEALDSGREGLTGKQAVRRLKEYGPNRIQRGREISAWEVLLHQFSSPLIYVLLGALVVTLAIQSFSDAIVIGAVLVINTVVGFIQEYQAESAVQSLMKMITPKAAVFRDGKEKQVDSSKLVPGDIVRLGQGKVIPADVRLVDVTSLQVNESALTGESVPVSKQREAMPDAPDDLPTADQKNMAFMGTAVTSGSAAAVVVRTGRDTRIGRIAEQVREAAEIETPLERRIRRLAKYITFGILIVAVISSGTGWLMGRDPYNMVLLGIALAVAAIPAGLPIVVTVALALGVRRMAQRHAVIRNLPAVDTLGSTTVIVSDKTGTLTQNQMTVRAIYAEDKTFRVSGGGTTFTGDITINDEQMQPQQDTGLWHALLVGLLCNEAEVRPAEKDDESDRESENASENGKKELVTRGDPMEAALLIAAGKGGLSRDELQHRFPRKDVVPFKTERRFMATIHEDRESGSQENLVLLKGAPEKVLEMCTTYIKNGEASELDPDALKEKSDALADEGLRVLAMAVGHGKKAAETVKTENPEGLVFAGFQGMIDPPRPTAVEAVDQCHASGIRVMMVTGDHARTAAAIAGKLHLERGPAHGEGKEKDIENADALRAFSGREIGRMSDEEFDGLLKRTNVFARVEPGQKLRLINRIKENNEIVAVTGDGVNDAPALKSAHIGAAMGSGTDVAKDASDMVITDDNFASVYAAVEEGRTAFRNIRMATFFLLSTGAADILIILTALFVGWPLPLLPAQILWCNVVTNGIADVALAFEPGERFLFERPPRSPNEGVLDRLMLERLVLVGVWLALGTLAMFWWKSGGGEQDLIFARTATLTTLVLFQKVHVFNCRSEYTSLFKKSVMENKVLFLGVLSSLGIHIGALYFPWTQKLLSFTPLDAATWAAAAGIALTAILINEGHKKFRRP
ncbi:MAG: HAD-IC family P-type ATPase [Desulfobacterales bacterium]